MVVLDSAFAERCGEYNEQIKLIKRELFEETEKCIFKNKRAHIKRIKIPTCTFSVGDSVLIKNPNHQGLVTTLNVVGSVTKRVCKDVYLVSYGQNYSIVLYAGEIVPYAVLNAPTCKNTTQLKRNLTLREIVERVRELSDTFRARTINAQDVVVSIAQDIDLDMILSDVAISSINSNYPDDLLTLQFFSHDCEFLSLISCDDY